MVAIVSCVQYTIIVMACYLCTYKKCNTEMAIYGIQLLCLFILAIPIACIAWTVTHEEVFREPREYCVERSKTGKTIAVRKFFYLFTCEYCFSHYVTAAFLVMTNYHLLYADWRGYLIGGFALVWIANVYMSLFGLLRVDIKVERVDATLKEELLANKINGSKEDAESGK
jgi:hypothetical protein